MHSVQIYSILHFNAVRLAVCEGWYCTYM